MEAHQIIKYPLSTEKSIRLIEAENKLIFAVHPDSDKKQIKSAVESLFKVTVTNIRTFRTIKGDKRAYVKFSAKTPAIDVATNLGLM